MKTDGLFCRLLQTEPTLAFELAGLAMPEPKRYGFISQELKQTAFDRVEGEAAVLLRLLERKFRPLPESARQRIAAADAETLLVWAERILDAKNLDEVWGH